MKNLTRTLSYLFSILSLSTLLLFSQCDNSSEGENGDADFVGTWTVTAINVDLMIDGESLSQFLIDGGMSESEAILLEAFFKALLEDEIGTGTIELKSDHTYVADFGDGEDTGKWSYNSSTKILTIDSDDPDEDTQEIMVKSISSTTIVIEQSEIIEEDIDDDGINEEIDSTIEMTLVKS